MSSILAFFRSTRGMVLFGFLVVALIAIPITVYLVQQQQTLQQSAHTPSPSVTTACVSSGVSITYTYNLTNIPSGVNATVTVTDSQNYVSDSFIFKNGDPPYSKQVQTNQQSILAGVLTFKTDATNGFKATNQAAYNATGPCASATLTPTISISNTPTPSPTETLTSTPSETLTPTPTNSITSTPTPTNSVTSTPTPTSQVTNTPTPTTGVNNSPTSTVAPTGIAANASANLPPVGPSQALLNLGIVGLVIVLIGGLLLFAL